MQYVFGGRRGYMHTSKDEYGEIARCVARAGVSKSMDGGPTNAPEDGEPLYGTGSLRPDEIVFGNPYDEFHGEANASALAEAEEHSVASLRQAAFNLDAARREAKDLSEQFLAPGEAEAEGDSATTAAADAQDAAARREQALKVVASAKREAELSGGRTGGGAGRRGRHTCLQRPRRRARRCIVRARL